MSGTLLLVESVVRLGAADAGEVLTLQRAAYVTEAQAHADLNLPPLRQSFAEVAAESPTRRSSRWAVRLLFGGASCEPTRSARRSGGRVGRRRCATAHGMMMA